jgi:phage shock protein B
MEEVVLIVAIVVIGLPWLVMHYVTRWKTAPSLTDDDEELLSELHNLARKLEERLETVERLVAAEHPDFRPDSKQLSDMDIRAERNLGQFTTDPLEQAYIKETKH